MTRRDDINEELDAFEQFWYMNNELTLLDAATIFSYERNKK